MQKRGSDTSDATHPWLWERMRNLCAPMHIDTSQFATNFWDSELKFFPDLQPTDPTFMYIHVFLFSMDFNGASMDAPLKSMIILLNKIRF